MNKRRNSSYNRIELKMNKLGYDVDPMIFIYMRLISSVILFVILLFSVKYGYIVSPIVTIIYYFIIEYIVLDLSLMRRVNELENDALEYFPVFLLSLKGEGNIKKALIVSTDVVNNSLSNEFRRVLYNERMGKSLDESLLTLKKRIPSDYIVNMIISIIEANRMGNSITENINEQLRYIEDSKNKSILKSYRIIPFKMAIISIMFVFAILFLMILCNL